MSEQASKKEKALARYAGGVNQLDEALAGLSESDLDLSREPGKWTIRQIVHHLVDTEEVWKICIKAALGNPGCRIDLNWYIVNNVCAGPLDYAHRPIADAVELFRATRRHILALLNYLPNAWEQPFTLTWSDMPKDKIFKVGDVIGFQNLHHSRHIKQIQETREKHGAKLA